MLWQWEPFSSPFIADIVVHTWPLCLLLPQITKQSIPQCFVLSYWTNCFSSCVVKNIWEILFLLSWVLIFTKVNFHLFLFNKTMYINMQMIKIYFEKAKFHLIECLFQVHIRNKKLLSAYEKWIMPLCNWFLRFICTGAVVVFFCIIFSLFSFSGMTTTFPLFLHLPTCTDFTCAPHSLSNWLSFLT